jgi:hypothetical protein
MWKLRRVKMKIAICGLSDPLSFPIATPFLPQTILDEGMLDQIRHDAKLNRNPSVKMWSSDPWMARLSCTHSIDPETPTAVDPEASRRNHSCSVVLLWSLSPVCLTQLLIVNVQLILFQNGD